MYYSSKEIIVKQYTTNRYRSKNGKIDDLEFIRIFEKKHENDISQNVAMFDHGENLSSDF